MTRFTSQLQVPLPPDWLAEESITIQAPDGAANVIASSEAVSVDVTTEAYAEASRQMAASEFPEYRELSFEPTETASLEISFLVITRADRRRSSIWGTVA